MCSQTREGTNEWGKCVTGWARERERERFFVPLGYISLGLGWTGSFSKPPINFPSFHGLLMGLHTLVGLIGLYGPAPPCIPQQTGTEQGKEGC